MKAERFHYLLSFEVHETVPSRLPLQSTWLVEEEVELLYGAELLEELEEVISAEKAQPVSTLCGPGQRLGLKCEIKAGR